MPEVPSVLLTGDGSFQMNIQELATARQFDVPVKCVIMNNGYLGMVRQWQELFWDKRYSQVDMGQWPDFVKLAEAYGATGMRLTDKTTLVAELQRSLTDTLQHRAHRFEPEQRGHGPLAWLRERALDVVDWVS